MKKFLAIALVAVLAMTAVFANGSSESASEIKIGFIGPLTGDYANYGTLCRQAVEMAIDECNAKGGINGSTVKLVAEDSEGDPNKALAAMEKLANTDKVCAVVGPVLTGEAFSVGPVACELGVLAVTPSASHKDVTNQGDYIFRTTPSDGLQGEVAGKYWAQVLGYKKIATLYAKNDYSQGLAEGMKESFEAEGGKIVAEETFMVGDKDFKTQLTKIAALKPEAIYIPNYTVEMAQILEQAAQLGIDIPFLSGDGFSDPMIYQLAGDFCDGVIYIGPSQAKASSVLTDFQAAYRKAYN